jgi:thioredoxin reductase
VTPVTDHSLLGVEHVTVAIVGGGPSGLSAACALASSVDGKVLVIERELETGGIPRHSDHPGYGVRDLHKFISGPRYARRLTRMARDSGARLETEAQVTGWDGTRRLLVTSPRGRRVVHAEAVVLATGARERPRSALLIPGDRPDGVYTTGQLQNLVYLNHAAVGRRAVVIGAEPVSWSAVMTLRDAGCRTVAMTSGYARSEAYAAFRVYGRLALRLPILGRTRVVRINGKDRVESVVVENVDTRVRETIVCDTVVTTGDWIPDHELARLGTLDMDPGTRGPVVDAGLRTSADGVFAVGNLVHPVDTADVAALDGRHVAGPIRQWLAGAQPMMSSIAMRAADPFLWVTPQRLVPGDRTPRHQLLLWTDSYRRLPVVRAIQGGRTLAQKRVLWPASPGRVFRVPSSLIADARPDQGDVTIELVGRPATGS